MILAVADLFDRIREQDVDPINEDNTVVFRGFFQASAGSSRIVARTGYGFEDEVKVTSATGSRPLLIAMDDPDNAGTKVSRETVALSGGADVLVVTSNRNDFVYIASGVPYNILNTLDAAKTIVKGYDGDDILVGGDGNDRLDGGAGRDILLGDDGFNASLDFNFFQKFLDGLKEWKLNLLGATVTFGPAGNGDDQLLGGDDSDFLMGGPGNDNLDGGAGASLMFGDAFCLSNGFGTSLDASKLEFGDLKGLAFGAAGAIKTALTKMLHFDYQIIPSFNLSCPTDGMDTIFGGSALDVVVGGGNNDQIYLGGGTADIAFGNDGEDTIHADAIGDAPANGHLRNQTATTFSLQFGGGDKDHLFGGSSAEKFTGNLLVGGDGDDELTGGAGIDVLIGDTFDYDGPTLTTFFSDLYDFKLNALIGLKAAGAGEDKLYGLDGFDVLIGGDKKDILQGGAGGGILFGDSFDASIGKQFDLKSYFSGDSSSADDDKAKQAKSFKFTGLLNTLFTTILPSFPLSGEGDDTIDGGSGIDLIIGGDGIDTVHTSDSTKPGTGSGFADIVFGNDGDDKLYGDKTDLLLMVGGKGDDLLDHSTAANALGFGVGLSLLFGDTFEFQGLPDPSSPTSFLDIEYWKGPIPKSLHIKAGFTQDGNGTDTIKGSTEAYGINLIVGGDGDDTITGGGGIDLVLGDSFNVGLNVGFKFKLPSISDVVLKLFKGSLPGLSDFVDTSTELPGFTGSGEDTIVVGRTLLDQVLHLAPSIAVVFGGDGKDTITARDGLNLLSGQEGDDTITGGRRGYNVIIGGPGKDELKGGDSSDIILGDSFKLLLGIVPIPLSGASLFNEGKFQIGVGLLEYGNGDDTIDAGAGDDLVIGGSGSDFIQAGDGFNMVYGDTFQLGVALNFDFEGAKKLLSGLFSGPPITKDAVYKLFSTTVPGEAGEGADEILGGPGSDMIFGGAGHDILVGGGGSDVLIGGDGLDGAYQGPTLGILTSSSPEMYGSFQGQIRYGLSSSHSDAENPIPPKQPAFLEFGTISGIKFEDVNSSGAKDPEDKGLADWRIFVDLNSNQALNNDESIAYTAAGSEAPGQLLVNGRYSFLVPVGTHQLYEVQQPGWTHTNPDHGPLTITKDPLLHDFTTFQHVNFANNHDLMYITGTKFDDINGNGVYDLDAGEPGIAGWTIELRNSLGELVGSAFTSASGQYRFEVHQPTDENTTFSLREVQSPEYVQTLPASNGSYEGIGFTKGTTVSDRNFGNFKYMHAMGRKYEDINGNDVQDPLEKGVPGWTIQLYIGGDGVSGGTLARTATTDADGNFTFDKIGPGDTTSPRVWTIREVVQGGWTPVASSFETLPMQSGLIVGGPGAAAFPLPNFRYMSADGVKFEDVNGNGRREAGEPPLADWTIDLYVGGDKIDSRTTGADGKFEFARIGPGDPTKPRTWELREVPQAHWTPTYVLTEPIPVHSGLQVIGHDFGNFRNMTVRGKKFEDLDLDGLYDAGEPGLSGWKILVDINDDGTAEYSATTDGGGNYEIVDIAPSAGNNGTFSVREVPKSPFTQTSPQSLKYVYAIQSRLIVTGADFGNAILPRIAGVKFEDRNANGVRDPEDPGISGWTITLDRQDGTTLTTVTGADGRYEFPIVRRIPGSAADTFMVREESRTGVRQTYPASQEYQFPFQSRLNRSNVDFGNYIEPTWSGTKFLDVNGNGQWDSNEPARAGWQITLDIDSNGTVDRTTITDSAGHFAFDRIPPGTHTVRETDDDDFVRTYPADPGTYAIEARSSEDVDDLIFGNMPLVAILSGTKFFDRNQDGQRGGDEQGLAGWTIFLDGNNDGILNGVPPSGACDQTATETCVITDSLGNWAFGVGPGTYLVREVQRPGWTQTAPQPEYSYLVTIESMSDRETALDFGNFQLGTITGIKFEDVDGDGVRGALEPVLPDWTIFVDVNQDGVLNGGQVGVCNASAAEPCAITDAAGAYEISGLAPGTYSLREGQLAGFVSTVPRDPNDYQVTVTPGSPVVRDFGNFATGRIAGQKFDDHDADGVKDPGDAGQADWVVYLDLDGDGSLDNPVAGPGNCTAGVVEPCVVTSGSGDYEFTGLRAGRYIVRQVVKPGFAQTARAPNDSYVVDNVSRSNVIDRDFGTFQSGVVTGVKFEDLDGDGIRDAGEPGLQDWIIFVDLNADGRLNNPISGDGVCDGQAAELCARTAADGTYVLPGVPAGNHRLREVPRDGWMQTTPPEITISLAGAFDFDLGTPLSIGNASDATESVALSFPFPFNGALYSTVFVSTNGFLWLGADGGPAPNPSASDFASGPPRLAPFWADLDPAAAGDIHVKQRGDRLMVTWDRLGLADGSAERYTFQAQLFETGKVVYSYGPISAPHGFTSAIVGVAPGGLAVVPAEFDFSADTPSSLPGVDTTFEQIDPTAAESWDLSGSSIQWQSLAGSHDIALTSGQTLADRTFGNFQLGSISGVVYVDLDRDHLRDPGEAGPRDVVVYLDVNRDGLLNHELSPGVCDDDAIEPCRVVGDDGAYRFDGLRRGEYVVRQVLRAGFEASQPTEPDQYSIVIDRSGIVELGRDFGSFAADAPPPNTPLPNGQFSIADPGASGFQWTVEGAASLAAGRGRLAENRQGPSSLSQTFVVPTGAAALQFEIARFNLLATASELPIPLDALEVQLVDASTGESPIQPAVGLTNTQDALNVQRGGLVYFGQEVSLSGISQSGQVGDFTTPQIVKIELDPSLAGRTLRLTFALLGYGPSDSIVEIDDVGLVMSATLVAQDDQAETGEDTLLQQPVGSGVLANDTGAVSITTYDSTSISGATISLASDGSFDYDPRTAAALQALNVGAQIADQFTYTISDGTITRTATVTVAVTGVNDAPIAAADTAQTNATTALNVAAPGVLANDRDADSNDPVTVSAFEATSARGATVTVDANGGFHYDGSNLIPFKRLFAGDTLNDSFHYTITDSHGASHSETVSITVVGVNTLPWQNILNYLDVNNDGNIAPIDALLVINELNEPVYRDPSTFRLPVRRPDLPGVGYLDVSGDYFAAPIDALIVINYLNDLVGPEGEGEFAALNDDFDWTTEAIDELFAQCDDWIVTRRASEGALPS